VIGGDGDRDGAKELAAILTHFVHVDPWGQIIQT
jgi:hypothetical protein